MKRVRFGATGLKVHPLCFGTMTLGGEADQRTSFRLLSTAFDNGLNFIDTANMYNKGKAETIIGKWLNDRGVRDQVILSSKVRYRYGDDPDTAGLSPRTVERELHKSLQRLNTDYLDIYFLHQPDHDTPLEVTWHCLDGLVRQGKVRYIGMSNYASWQIMEAINLARAHGWVQPTVIQCMYNLIARYPELELFPMCRAYGLGVCNFNPLAGGLLTGKYGLEDEAKEGRLSHNKMYQARYWHQRQRKAAMDFVELAVENKRTAVELAIQFCLAQPAISTVILGATRVDQLKQAISAHERPPLADEEIQDCNRIWDDLRGPVPNYAR